ncbi:MAG: succinylglutamate desuccinylase/aspartoacylase family protein [Casimicrobium sp.]
MNAVIETQFPDIRAWQHGSIGVPYVWRFVSDIAGPHLCVTALVHGNEVCGAIAGDWLLRELHAGARVRQGTLSIVFANVDAYHAFDTAKPFESRCVDEDFNRLWDVATLDGSRDSRELRRARELRPFYDTVDHLLDLHSMTEPAPPIGLAGDTEKGLALAHAVGVPAHILVDSGHAAGKRLRDYVEFGDAVSAKSALLVECGQHWEATVGDVAKQVVLRFLNHFDALDKQWVVAHLDAGNPPAQHVVDISTVITVKSAEFRWIRPLRGLEVIVEAGTLIAIDGDVEVRTPHVDAVMVMPVPNPKVGQTAVRIGRFRSP